MGAIPIGPDGHIFMASSWNRDSPAWVGAGGLEAIHLADGRVDRWCAVLPKPEYQLTEERMLIAIARFPEVPTECEAEFRAWFAWSNDQLREVDGLQGRRLLRAADGSYTALLEHDSAESFAAMQATEAASQVHAQLGELIPDGPVATTYEVVSDLEKAGSCCGGTGAHGDARGHDLVMVGVSAEAQVAGGCCRGA